MNPRRFTNVEAYQHSNDGYYYRPLVSGADLFTYVAHVPVGGHMPADAEEAELFELSLFMLEGQLEAQVGAERIAVDRGDALHVPRGEAFGVTNSGSQTATFVLSFSPPPSDASLETFRERAVNRGQRIIEAEDVEEEVGKYFFPNESVQS